MPEYPVPVNRIIPKIEPGDPEWIDGKCNARRRHGAGYCRLPAGFKTKHLGTGRCHLHGGCGGRPPAYGGLYAPEFKQTLAEKAEAIRQHPELYSIMAEFVLVKALTASVLGALPENPHDWFETGMETIDGQRVRTGTDHMAKIRTLITLQDSARKTYKTMVDAEQRARTTLSFHDLMAILEQVRSIIDNVCKDCPHRSKIKEQILDGLRVPETPMQDAEYEELDPTGQLSDAADKAKKRERVAETKRKSRARVKEREKVRREARRPLEDSDYATS